MENNNNLQLSLNIDDSHFAKDKKFMKVAFFIFGIGGLLAWNAILSDLGFFAFHLSDFNPYVSFPFLNFILNIAFQFILLFKKKTISYQKQLVFTLILSTISLLTLPACVLISSSQLINFIASGINIILQGFINAVALSSFFGLASYFPAEFIIVMSTGQGMAGILMNLIQYLLLFSLPSTGDTSYDSTGTWIFFGISALIIVICCIFVIMSYQNKYFLQIMKNSGDLQGSEQISDPEMSGVEPIKVDSDPSTSIKTSENEQQEDNKENKGFVYLILKVRTLNILIFLNYLITFTFYPGACMKCPLFTKDSAMIANTVVFIFNVFDTIGRNIVSYFTPKKNILITVVVFRLVFIVTISLNAIFNIDSYYTLLSYITVVNCALFGLTNGLSTSLCYSLAPNEVEDKLKGKAGSSISFFNILGIFAGTCAAFGSDYIINACNNLLK